MQYVKIIHMNDPYSTLGVSQTATLDEIKKAYRNLAKKHHPDLNPGNKEAEKRFKEVSHAFDLIGTAEAKGKFDRKETDEQKQKMYEEQVRKQHTSGRPSYQHTQQDGGRYSSSFSEDFSADELFSNLFGNTRGGRQDRPGEDQLYNLEIDFLEAALGAEKMITLPTGKKLQVKIPTGIEEGKKLKFKGLGSVGRGQGPPGDVLIQISIKPSLLFKREGQDILSELAISMFEAVGGAEVDVATIDGPVKLKIPAGVSTGSKLRIRNKGVSSGEDRGNHLVTLKVVMPREPSAELKHAMADLATKFSYDPRTVE